MKSKQPINKVLPIALEMETQLKKYCERIQIAGSIRRLKPEVGDIEIVCIPKFEHKINLRSKQICFIPEDVNLLLEYLDIMLEDGIINQDKQTPAWGDSYRKFIYNGYQFDIFSADHDNWGNILAIRTGPHEFSKKLVTKRQWGGHMPNHLRQKDGYLWHGLTKISCPEEVDFFNKLGLSWINPEARK